MKLRIFKIYTFILFLICCLFYSGCSMFSTVTEDNILYKAYPFEYPQFKDDIRYEGLEEVILQNISYLQKRPSDMTFNFGQDSFNAAHMLKSCEFLLKFIKTKPSTRELGRFIKKNYIVYKSMGSEGSGDILFTGYYEPVLKGSFKKTSKYRFPVYACPDDLITVDLSLFSARLAGENIAGRFNGDTFIPYYSREEIDYKGAIEGKAKKIVWVADKISLFFLQIQGSGKIYTENGKLLNIHYHKTNGHPYRSIGKLLVNKNKIPMSEISMQTIKAYLKKHPKEAKKILSYNPSYVFFKLEKEGPIGCLNIKLTPGRSVALDRSVYPLGALAFIETEKPLVSEKNEIIMWTNFSRFVLAQDTGGAIRGPGRADLFWGNGTYATIAAGHMQHMGTLYFLVKKRG